MRCVKNVETGQMERNDTFKGDMEIWHINEERYLGQIISSDGKNTENIEKIRNREIRLQNNVIHMLEAMPGGKFHFKKEKMYIIKLRNMVWNNTIWTRKIGTSGWNVDEKFKELFLYGS